MSIASALGNAVSGLTASSRMAEVVSSNIANAMTQGYARRELSLSAETLGGEGGGVRINGVNRVVNASLLQDKRLADAAAANTSAKTAFHSRVETQIGDPNTEGSLSWTISEFENSLLSAASMPDSTARLTAVASAASTVADKLNAISEDLQATRLKADQSITKQVRILNETLAQVQEMNRTITTQISVGNDATGLMDARQSLIDQISEIVPLRVVQRDNNQVALFTKGGAALLDGSAIEVGFEGAGVMAPGYSLSGGPLHGLTIDGIEVSSTDSGPFGGGTLGAAFTVRDDLAPAAQTKLDAFAIDLMSRFQDASVVTAGQPGLFTDSDGTAYSATTPIGISGRLRLNAAVDPAQGGQVWKLRAGLDATSEGAVSDAKLLNAMSDAMTTERVPPASGGFGSSLRSVAGLGSDLLSFASSARQSAELTGGYATARQEALTELALADGVDTDYEMQTLLVVEKAYAANAKVIQTIDAMLQELLDL